MLLAQMVVEYVADITKLVSGVQSATKSMNTMQSAASASASSLTSSFKGATASMQALAKKAEDAGLNVAKLASLQLKAGESAARLGVAQASAALALKKADDMALAGTASAQQIAVAQARAALAADHVKVAEDAAANAMAKVDAESKKLSDTLQDATSKSSILARGTDALKGSLESMGEQAKAITAVGLAVAAGSALALGGALASTVGPAKDFQATMLKVNALAGLSKKEVDAASDAILRMAGRVGKGPQDLAEGLYYVASAGYDAKTAMEILEVSAKAASVGMTSTQNVANALTAALAIFPGMEVAEAIDMMTKTVSTGKTEWEDYAVVVGKMAKNASNAGIEFAEVNAAFAVMTNTMPSSEQAADALNALLQTSSRFSLLTDRAEKLNLTFDISKYKTLDLAGRVAYLSEVTDGNTESLTTMLGQENAVMAATTIAAEGAADYSKALDGITNSSGAANAAFATVAAGAQASWDKAKGSLEALQIKIGNALIPAVTAFTDKVAPLIGKMIEWAEENHIVENATNAISGALTSASKEMSKFVDIGARVVAFFRENEGAMTAFQITGAILAATFLAIAVAAGAAAIAEAAAAWPILLVVAAVVGLTAAFIYFYNNATPFRDFMNALGAVFIKVWAVVVEQFTPAWNELSIAFKKIQPALEMVGRILGGVLLVAIGLVFAAVVALAMGLAASVGGIVRVFTGMIEVVSGVFDVLGGVFLFIMDLITGRFDKLGGDLARIGGGFVQIFKGLWDVIAGVFQTAVGVVWGIIAGFCQGIIGYFQGLYNALVGHSIIPDMVNAIVNWFSQLPARVGTWVINMYNTVIDWFGKMPGRIMEFWETIKSNIGTAWSWIQTTISSKAGEIFNNIMSPFNRARDAIGGVVKGFVNNAVSTLNSGIGGVESFVNLFGTAINWIADKLGAGNPIPHFGIGRIPGYAAGTDFHPGGPAIVGERGPELLMLPKGSSVLPNPQTMQLLAGGSIPGYAEGIGDIFSWIGGGAKSILDNVMSAMNVNLSLPGSLSGIASGMVGKVKDWALGFIDKMLPKFGGVGPDGKPVNIPGDVASWIASAMALTGTPASWGQPLGVIAMHESGGNPNAQNNWDSNAAAGIPSKGLFQTIEPTFRAHMLPGHTNIFNPIDNAAAAIGYIKGRYGDVFHVPGIAAMAQGKPYVGYANGGIINEPVAGIGLKTGTRYGLGENGPEAVMPLNKRLNTTPQGGSSREDIHVHVYLDGRDITDKVQTRVLKESRRGPIRA